MWKIIAVITLHLTSVLEESIEKYTQPSFVTVSESWGRDVVKLRSLLFALHSTGISPRLPHSPIHPLQRLYVNVFGDSAFPLTLD